MEERLQVTWRRCQLFCFSSPNADELTIKVSSIPWEGGGGLLPIDGLMGMCRWMGSYFPDWIDYNGIAFSTEFPTEVGILGFPKILASGI